MEKAVHALGRSTLTDTEHLHENWTLVQQYPLSRELLALSHVWKSTAGAGYVVATKGAPEAIADLCHFDAPAAAALARDVHEMADRGLRVIGVARAGFGESELPDIQHEFVFQFIGLIGLEDPIRPTVPAADQRMRRGGDQGGDDHGRLPGDGAEDRPADRDAGLGERGHGAGAGPDGPGGAAPSG